MSCGDDAAVHRRVARIAADPPGGVPHGWRLVDVEVSVAIARARLARP